MILNTIRRWVNRLVRGFWGLLKAVFTGATEIILAQLKDIAIASVTKLDQTDMTNAEKRNAAFKEIKNYAIGKKIEVKDHLINFLIELAVASLKAKIR